jgi:hypothetical protein
MTEHKIRRIMADLGAHGIFIFCVPLNDKMDNRFLVLVLQKAEHHKGTSSAPICDVSGDVLEIDGHSCPSLAQRGMSGLRPAHDIELTGIAPPSSSVRRRTARSVRLKSSNWNIRA